MLRELGIIYFIKNWQKLCIFFSLNFRKIFAFFISRNRLKQVFSKKRRFYFFLRANEMRNYRRKNSVRKKCEIFADDLLFSHKTLL